MEQKEKEVINEITQLKSDFQIALMCLRRFVRKNKHVLIDQLKNDFDVTVSEIICHRDGKITDETGQYRFIKGSWNFIPK